MKWISKDAVMDYLDTLKSFESVDSKEKMMINTIENIINRLPAHEFDLDQEVKDDDKIKSEDFIKAFGTGVKHDDCKFINCDNFECQNCQIDKVIKAHEQAAYERGVDDGYAEDLEDIADMRGNDK